MDMPDRERRSGAALLLVRCRHTGAAQAVPRSNQWLSPRGQAAPQLGSRGRVDVGFYRHSYLF